MLNKSSHWSRSDCNLTFFKFENRYFRHFMQADAKKFHDVWCMNEEECKELANAVLEADRIVFEHQLGLRYKVPEV